jgi:A/G-specific adenine glycosylase
MPQSKPSSACADFATRLVEWQQAQGRHHLPWQVTDPYRVWLSEIMLQQTQVVTVIPYYQRFLARFPTVADLAAATQEAVMPFWAGLGYYSRARNLHQAAQRVVHHFGGQFPNNLADLQSLPGVGESTAAAIYVFAFQGRAAILDGNVKRVLARFRGIEGEPNQAATKAQLWQQAQALLPQTQLIAYTQGLMDLGATRCTRAKPRCGECPVQADCVAFNTDRVACLPTRKVRPPLPLREVNVIILQVADHVFIMPRPSPGIWGGLHSLPETEEPEQWIKQHAPNAQFQGQLAPIKHSFTHYRLLIKPLLFHDNQRSPSQTWLDLNTLANPKYGLAKPIAKLLATIQLTAG